MPPSRLSDRVAEVTLYIGDVHAAQEPTVVRTLLGSCIAVCLWDPAAGVGGMNHFMLPRALTLTKEESARFGVHAMELLIGAVMKVGAERARLRAKVFGAGHVLDIEDSDDSVPQQNIAFIREFMRTEGLPVVAWDLGGTTARQVHFETHTGRALVRRLRSGQMRERVIRLERQASTPTYGEVTIF